MSSKEEHATRAADKAVIIDDVIDDDDDDDDNLFNYYLEEIPDQGGSRPKFTNKVRGEQQGTNIRTMRRLADYKR